MPAILTSKILFDAYHNTSTLSNILKGTTPLECLSLSSEAEVIARYEEFQRLDAIRIQSGKTVEDIQHFNLLQEELEPNWFSYHRITGGDAFLLDFILLGKNEMLHPCLEPSDYDPTRVPWTQEQVENDRSQLIASALRHRENEIKYINDAKKRLNTNPYRLKYRNGKPYEMLSVDKNEVVKKVDKANQEKWRHLMRPLRES